MASTRSKSSSNKNDASNEFDVQNVPLHFVKELLQVQESTMKTFLSAYFESANNRMDNLLKEVQDLKTSLEFTQAQVDSIMQSQPQKKDAFENIQNDVENLKDKADDLENRSRRNNLCFEGIPESSSESWEQSETKIKEIINDKLELEYVDDIVIERAHRIGSKKSEKPRAIVAKFLSYKDRENVFKAKRKLKGSRIFIREDYSDRISNIRRELTPKMMEARKSGKIAFIRYDKLIVQDRYPPTMNYTAPGSFAPPGMFTGPTDTMLSQGPVQNSTNE